MTSPRHLLPRPGRLLDDRWLVHAALQGAMSDVLVVSDPATGRRLAAKTPRADRPLDERARRIFATEVATWVGLGRHENVVEALFLEMLPVAGEERPFLFLEYVDGPTLGDVVAAERRLAIPVVLDVASGVAWGLAHAHGLLRAGPSVVHRDLKPENVFLTRHRVAKVSDFGIARALDRTDDIVGEGLGAGTPYYAAPEQLRDARSAGVRSDVYSFGALLYRLLAGGPPHEATSLSQLVLQVMRGRVVPLRERRADVPPRLATLVERCLSRDPRERPDGFRDVLRALSGLREDDSLWQPSPGAMSCPSCGWQTVLPRASCSVCEHPTESAVRYAPAARRTEVDSPTLGRSGGGSVEIVGVECRPRVPRAGDHVVITALLHNPGSRSADGVVVPFRAPDAHAFERPPGFRTSFRGSVPPTADEAPLRVSWSVRALREGRFRLRSVRATWTDDEGRRQVAAGPELTVRVEGEGEHPLVGLDEPRRRVAALLEPTRDGPAAVLVTGRFGTGKSRLSREALRVARSRGFAVGRGRVLARGSEVRGALKDALRTALGTDLHGGDRAAVTAELVEALGDVARGRTDLLEFLAAEVTGSALPRDVRPERMWAEFAVALARTRPLLLVLEDVGRDDDVVRAAGTIVEAAGAAGSAVVVLLTARDDVAELVRSAFDGARASAGALETLALAPLTRDETRRLLDAVFAPHDFATAAPWLADEVHRVAGGNPLLVVETARALRAPGRPGGPLVQTLNGRWTVSPFLRPATIAELVPARAEEILLDRVETLDADSLRLVRVAALLGDAVGIDLLIEAFHAVSGGETDVAGALQRLESEGFLRARGGVRERVRFWEPLLPDLLAKATTAALPDLAHEVHRVAAEALSRRGARGGGAALRLARHLEGARRPAHAFRAYLDAGESLSGRLAHSRAGDAVRAALALVASGDVEPRDDEHVRLTLLRAESLRFSGELTGALRTYREVVLADGARAVPGPALATAHAKMGRVLELLGRDDEALYEYTIGLGLRREHGLERDASLSLVHLARLHYRRGDAVAGRRNLEEAIATAERTGNRRASARCHAVEARVAALRGATRSARVHAREALRGAREARDRATAAEVFSALSLASRRDARNSRALRWARRALVERQGVGEPVAIGVAWRELGEVHAELDQREEARRAFERANGVHRRVGDRRGVGFVLLARGSLELAEAVPRRASETLERARDLIDQRSDPAAAAAVLAHLARAAVRTQDDCDEGKRLLAEARTTAADVRHTRSATALARAEMDLARACGDEAAAAAAAEWALAEPLVSPTARVEALVATAVHSRDADAAAQALELADRDSRPRSVARAAAAVARLARAAGDVAAARHHLRRGVGLLRASASYGPLVLRLMHDLADVEDASDPAAAAAGRRRARDVREDLRRRGYSDRYLAAVADSPSPASDRTASIVAPAADEPPDDDPMTRLTSVTLACRLAEVPPMRARFMAELVVAEVASNERDVWGLVFTELVNNAVEHGSVDEDARVSAAWSVTATDVRLIVTDQGGFDPGLRARFDREVTDFAETGRGVGLILVREFMDDIDVSPGAEGGTRVAVRRLRECARADSGPSAEDPDASGSGSKGAAG